MQVLVVVLCLFLFATTLTQSFQLGGVSRLTMPKLPKLQTRYVLSDFSSVGSFDESGAVPQLEEVKGPSRHDNFQITLSGMVGNDPKRSNVQNHVVLNLSVSFFGSLMFLPGCVL